MARPHIRLLPQHLRHICKFHILRNNAQYEYLYYPFTYFFQWVVQGLNL